MNVKKVKADLLRNRCQMDSCGVLLPQYKIFCYWHFRCLPEWARKRYYETFGNLELDQRLDRTAAWKKTVKKLGVWDASELLAKHRDTIELLKQLIKNHLLEEFAEKVRLSKWNENGTFNENYNTDRTWI